ncbi:MAG: hypothetical protein VYB19_04010 [Bacteroidota bacterium]|nr:hypothetical protein [Bacteroidota bacterium]
MSEKLFFDFLDREYKLLARYFLIIILLFEAVFFLYDYDLFIYVNFIDFFYNSYDLYSSYIDSVVVPLWDFFAEIGFYDFYYNNLLNDQISYPIVVFVDYLISMYPIIIFFMLCSWISSFRFGKRN